MDYAGVAHRHTVRRIHRGKHLRTTFALCANGPSVCLLHRRCTRSMHRNTQFANNSSQNRQYETFIPNHESKIEAVNAFRYINQTHQRHKVDHHNYVIQILFHAISERYARDLGAVREFTIDNSSCELTVFNFFVVRASDQFFYNINM